MTSFGGAFTRHIVEIDAPAHVVWDKLVDKIRRPDKYVPGVTNVEIVDDINELCVERKMSLGEKIVHEHITADPLTKTVVFKMLSNPTFRGFVINTLYEDDGKVYLDYTMNWHAKDAPGPDSQAEMEQAIRNAVEHTKQIAEAAANSTDAA
jgi:hypothetical protein